MAEGKVRMVDVRLASLYLRKAIGDINTQI